MSDLIKREDAIKAVEECLKLLARPRYTVKTAIEAIPSVDIPHSDDWEKYSDKLWKNAYDRGKADRPQEWIPCSERLPKYYDEYLVTLESPQMLIIGIAEYEPDEMLVAGGKWYLDDYDRVHSDLQVIAWMPLPKPWKGADDEISCR